MLKQNSSSSEEKRTIYCFLLLFFVSSYHEKSPNWGGIHNNQMPQKIIDVFFPPFSAKLIVFKPVRIKEWLCIARNYAWNKYWWVQFVLFFKLSG